MERGLIHFSGDFENDRLMRMTDDPTLPNKFSKATSYVFFTHWIALLHWFVGSFVSLYTEIIDFHFVIELVRTVLIRLHLCNRSRLTYLTQLNIIKKLKSLSGILMPGRGQLCEF
jgi:hypothetical protein